ncbi:MAG: hypothetical protein ALAOOOJD_02242 [bacterium]|nr:hypothetical protein [bacterium]
MKALLLVIIALLALTIYNWTSDWEISQPPGVLAPEAPQQTPLPKPLVFEKAGYQITALARFRLSARILHRERYWLDRGAELAPIDLALGWGPMSDQRILAQLDISQNGRRYFWWASSLPLAAAEINAHAANMHMIPANTEIDGLLKGLRRGQIITLRGYLVAVKAEAGWSWRSSLSRTDSGDGACEVVWVESLAVRP